jgi:hypothetical protein
LIEGSPSSNHKGGRCSAIKVAENRKERGLRVTVRHQSLAAQSPNGDGLREPLSPSLG